MAISDYVRLLREVIGKQLLLLPSVSVLVQDDDDRLLLVRHADSGLWGLVGGAVELDERPDEAAIRETRRGDRVAGGGHPPGSRTRGPGVQGHLSQWRRDGVRHHRLRSTSVGGVERTDGDEVLELGWFGRNDLSAIDLGAIAQATLRELGWLPV